MIDPAHSASPHHAPASGDQMMALAARLFPVLRSITGPGVSWTLEALRDTLAPGLAVLRVPSGTQVHDWLVPPEWQCRAARLTGEDGRVWVDLADHALHVLNYSTAVDAWFSLEELGPNLHTLPDQPDLIPYRTSYYAPRWGFCLPESLRQQMPPGRYHAYIDAHHDPAGALTYGEWVIPGEHTDEEVLLSTHVCHPQLADDNVAAMVVLAALGGYLAQGPQRRLTYRMVFVPGTIGAISMLARTPGLAERVRAGLVLALLGDGTAPFSYKETALGGTLTDRHTRRVLQAHPTPAGPPAWVPWSPYGYDERQYNAPGQRMPIGRLSRRRHGEFATYHTSGDDLSALSPGALSESLSLLIAWVDTLERAQRPRSRVGESEPQLGRRGLYRALSGGQSRGPEAEMALLWLLNLADGQHTLECIAERAGLTLLQIQETAQLLADHDLIELL